MAYGIRIPPALSSAASHRSGPLAPSSPPSSRHRRGVAGNNVPRRPFSTMTSTQPSQVTVAPTLGRLLEDSQSNHCLVLPQTSRVQGVSAEELALLGSQSRRPGRHAPSATRSQPQVSFKSFNHPRSSLRNQRRSNRTNQFNQLFKECADARSPVFCQGVRPVERWNQGR